MKAERLRINSQSALTDAIAKISAMYREHKYVLASIRPGKDRTIDQNALWFALYERIASMTEMGEVEDARRYCKLHFGVRIMQRDDADFRDGWNRLLLNLPYEDKLQMMGSCALFGPDGFPVTRLFNRKQGIEYTERIVAEFSGRGVVFDDLLSEQE